MFGKAQEEHQWLKQLVGEWTFETEGTGEPDQPPFKSTGTEIVRAVGDLWVIAEGNSSMCDGNVGTMIITLGYDPPQGKFLGTFVGSMMTHLWVYRGNRDASGKRLELETEGPDFSNEGQTVPYLDVFEYVDADTRLLLSHQRGGDGQWKQFMRAVYHRRR